MTRQSTTMDERLAERFAYLFGALTYLAHSGDSEAVRALREYREYFGDEDQ